MRYMVVIPSSNIYLDCEKIEKLENESTHEFTHTIIGLHVLHVLNMHTKFCANWILFIIRSRNSSFMYNFNSKNLKFEHLTEDIVIDFI